MKKLILLIAAVLSYSAAISQTEAHIKAPYPGDVSIGLQSMEREGAVISIRYKMLFGEGVRSCKVALFLSVDGGNTFSTTPIDRFVYGDIGKLNYDGDKCISYDVSYDKRYLAGKKLAFKVEVLSKDVIQREYFLLGTASVFPQLSYGAMVGTVKRVGWYLKARSDFKSSSTAYTCLSNGLTEQGGRIWSSGKSQTTRFCYTGGMLFHATRWLYPFVGAGYGERQLQWNDIENNWVTVSDKSCEGVSFDVGSIFKVGNFVMSVSGTVTDLKYSELEVGVGFMF